MSTMRLVDVKHALQGYIADLRASLDVFHAKARRTVDTVVFVGGDTKGLYVMDTLVAEQHRTTDGK